ncbi:MAG: glutamate--cysteine ligase, partial [Alphaproteobacteria bacterium]|nr:glutamate--cysteine ligase [Alphaproteobacteria bacterium]
MAVVAVEAEGAIEDRRELVEWFEQGCKPPEDWRCGTEHEKFVFRRSDLSRPGYDDPDGIGEL